MLLEGRPKRKLKELVGELDVSLENAARPLGTLLERLASSRGLDLEKAVKRLGVNVFARIKARTPVDTGAARRGWAIEYQKTAHGGVTTISNRLKYIVFLEVGSSKQAPNGMVRVTLAEARAELERALGEGTA